MLLKARGQFEASQQKAIVTQQGGLSVVGRLCENTRVIGPVSALLAPAGEAGPN